MSIYRIPAENLDKFLDEIAKLNKRAAKLGCPPVTVTETGVETYRLVRIADAHGYTHSPVMRVAMDAASTDPNFHYAEVGVDVIHLYEVAGEAPKIAGWTFCATVQWIDAEDGGTIPFTFQVPGTPTPPSWINSTDPSRCDHCHMRRNRKAAYIVHHDETGEWKQVGSTCLGDFLGHADPENVAAWAQILATMGTVLGDYEDEGDYDEDEYGMPRRGHATRWSLRRFLEVAALAIRVNGWVSSSAARDIPGKLSTAKETVAYFMTPTNWKRGWQTESPSVADQALAEAVMNWMTDLSSPEQGWGEGNEYLDTLARIGRLGIVETKLAGFAASAIVAYQRELERRLAHERMQHSQHMGREKDKIAFDATLIGVRTLEGYGRFQEAKTMYKFLTPEGNVAVWFSSNDLNLRQGEQYHVAGTVKKLDVYNGIQQTIVTRCKVSPLSGEPPKGRVNRLAAVAV